MKRCVIALCLLAACDGDSFGDGDAACPRCGADGAEDAVDEIDAKAGDAGVDVVDAALDVVADVPVVCELTKASGFESDSCEVVNDPECAAPCEVDGAITTFGIACIDTFTSVGHAPADWLRPTCLASSFDAGAGRYAFCCAKSACVRDRSKDSTCTNAQTKYAWDCPAGPTVVVDASGATHCSCGVGPCAACCDIAGP